MSGMPIILGTIQRAVMDTVHLVGQGGGWGGEREKAGIKICDMEYEKSSMQGVGIQLTAKKDQLVEKKCIREENCHMRKSWKSLVPVEKIYT
ncbi:hypothetical protein T09_2277 [Trichinella sp. T9]|nr:hypothetical protein T09_2277 [Trichinella sp. T9]